MYYRQKSCMTIIYNHMCMAWNKAGTSQNRGWSSHFLIHPDYGISLLPLLFILLWKIMEKR